MCVCVCTCHDPRQLPRPLLLTPPSPPLLPCACLCSEFVCVENAQATSPVSLAPGQSWAATTAMAFTTDPLVGAVLTLGGVHWHSEGCILRMLRWECGATVDSSSRQPPPHPAAATCQPAAAIPPFCCCHHSLPRWSSVPATPTIRSAGASLAVRQPLLFFHHSVWSTPIRCSMVVCSSFPPETHSCCPATVLLPACSPALRAASPGRSCSVYDD